MIPTNNAFNTTTIIKKGKNNFQFLKIIPKLLKIWYIMPGTFVSLA
jgi:hypothetical protein